jgi:peptidoglycan/xylan/chitin deacetylase (PgdA/CDA1 family)
MVVALRRVALRQPAILGYHGVTACRARGDLHRLQVHANRFRLHLEMMLTAGFRFVPLRTLVDAIADGGAAGASAARGLAAVTFDDGLRNNLTVAQPILSALGISATVFVTSNLIGGYSPWLGAEAGGEMLSADDLRALVAYGWELGVHTASHADLSKLGYDQCVEEMSRCMTALELNAGVRAETLAYPYGNYGGVAVAAARAVGLRAAVAVGSGSWARYELTRAMISARDPLWVVLLKIANAYEPLFASPAVRFIRNSSRAQRERMRSR